MTQSNDNVFISFQPKSDSPRTMLLISVCRFVFIPLFLFCNVSPRHNLPVLFKSDVAPCIIMMFFAISNGYFGTLCMMYGPQ